LEARVPALDRPIDIPLPKGWSRRVRSGAIHAIDKKSLFGWYGHAPVEAA
jgi:hypothetical protein